MRLSGLGVDTLLLVLRADLASTPACRRSRENIITALAKLVRPICVPEVAQSKPEIGTSFQARGFNQTIAQQWW